MLLAEPGDDEARATACRLLQGMAALEVDADGERRAVTCSIGGAVRRADEPFDELYARADRCLYLAKEEGRNRVGWDDRVIAVGEPSAASARARRPPLEQGDGVAGVGQEALEPPGGERLGRR